MLHTNEINNKNKIFFSERKILTN